jgi:uncharacterized protein
MPRSRLPLKNPSRLAVHFGTSATSALVYRAEQVRIDRTLVLGHGAGAGQESGFMVAFSRALSTLGVDVVTFDFPYIQERRRIPDRPPVLEACYRAVIDAVHGDLKPRRGLFIGGKSMGGRIATQVAAADRSLAVDGLVLLGYPLHPPGRHEELRSKHLPAIGRPMLFVQGSRDAFGTPAELQPILDTLSPRPALYVVEGGDHSFKIPRRDAAAQTAAYANAQQAIVSWMSAVNPAATSTP